MGPHDDRKPAADEVVVVVNGSQVTRDMYNSYASVFRNPTGVLEATPTELLTSLINQALVHEEAERRGIHIDPDVVDDNLAQAEALMDVHRQQIDRAGGVDQLKIRLAAFLEMNAVKNAVLMDSVLMLPEAPLPSNRGDSLRRQEAWKAWLDRRRACAIVVVYDFSLGVPSSTPHPACSTAT
ncbi:MAG: hypothetical protein WD830_12395 [Chloroflexota bacterium]